MKGCDEVMYVKAIEKNRKFVFPIMIGIKRYDTDNVDFSIAAMTKINNEGYFVTCKHVAELLKMYLEFNKERDNVLKIVEKSSKITSKKEKKKFDQVNNLTQNFFIDMHLILPFDLGGQLNIDITMHNYLDIAIIKFSNIKIDGECPTFSKNNAKVGMSVCKLGFAFSNGNPFSYDSVNHNIVCNMNNGFEYPIFPFDGMITRNINMNFDDGMLFENSAFEMSTAGLRGQSGGPVFDTNGIIYGIQSMNCTMPLDIIGRDTKNGKNKEYPQFINTSIGIDSISITNLFDENKIEYNCNIKEDDLVHS